MIVPNVCIFSFIIFFLLIECLPFPGWDFQKANESALGMSVVQFKHVIILES